MLNTKQKNLAPILWIDKTSKDDKSKKMLNFMKKTFQVFPAITIQQAQNILTSQKRQFSIICSNLMAQDVANELMKLNQVKNICIFCNYLKKGEQNVQTFKGKFLFAKNHLNPILDYFSAPQVQKQEQRQLQLFSDEAYGKLLFHIGRIYMDAQLIQDSQNYLKPALELIQNPKMKKQIQKRLQRIRELR